MKKIISFVLVLSLVIGLAAIGFSDSHEDQEEVIEQKVMTVQSAGIERAPYIGPLEGEKMKGEVEDYVYYHFPAIKYETEHPGVDIKLKGEVYPYGDMLKSIMLAVTSQSTFDYVEMDDIWLGKVAASGYLSDKYSDQYEKWANDLGMYDVFKKGSSYKGTYYGLWRSTDTRAIWVWKDVLHEAGYTMEDIMTCEGMLEALPDITETAKEDFGMAGGLEYPFNGKWVVDQWYGWLYQLGGKILEQNEDGEWVAGFNNEAGYRSLNYVKKLKESGATMQRSWQWMLANFLDRNYAMTYEGSWDIGAIHSKYPDLSVQEIKEKIGVIPTTVFEGHDMRVLTGGWLWTIPETAKHPDVAFEVLMEVFEDREAYAEMTAYQGEFPTTDWIWESPTYKERMIGETLPKEWFDRFREGVAGGVWRPFFPEYPEIQKELWDATQKVVMGKATAEKALATAEKKVNQLMED
ncbi:extracellular solute-binding protein [Candidatus Bipolaricaulota bacterium]|nr:extracellular solute-binding protein [Candidatus Bipolaricaulota bacterium]MBS3813846.1 extracellular solute-binding protein [Candidatus Bipolaricaulota bacterium]